MGMLTDGVSLGGPQVLLGDDQTIAIEVERPKLVEFGTTKAISELPQGQLTVLVEIPFLEPIR